MSNRGALLAVGCALAVGCGGMTQVTTGDLELKTADAAAGAASAAGPSATVRTPGASAVGAPAASPTTSTSTSTSTSTGCSIAGVAAPPGSSCNLLGEWALHSNPWNGLSTDARITFCADGTLTGEPSFTGKWSLAGSELSISDTRGADMTCGYTDHWTLAFKGDCITAPLLPIDSGCTGSRRYLDWDVTLSRP